MVVVGAPCFVRRELEHLVLCDVCGIKQANVHSGVREKSTKPESGTQQLGADSTFLASCADL
eukprot:6460706-Amphidinium_carterae.3